MKLQRPDTQQQWDEIAHWLEDHEIELCKLTLKRWQIAKRCSKQVLLKVLASDVKAQLPGLGKRARRVHAHNRREWSRIMKCVRDNKEAIEKHSLTPDDCVQFLGSRMDGPLSPSTIAEAFKMERVGYADSDRTLVQEQSEASR